MTTVPNVEAAARVLHEAVVDELRERGITSYAVEVHPGGTFAERVLPWDELDVDVRSYYLGVSRRLLDRGWTQAQT